MIMKKTMQITLSVIGIAFSVLFAKEAARAYLTTWEPLLLVVFVVFVAGALGGLVSLLECTPLAEKAADLFNERKEDSHE